MANNEMMVHTDWLLSRGLLHTKEHKQTAEKDSQAVRGYARPSLQTADNLRVIESHKGGARLASV